MKEPRVGDIVKFDGEITEIIGCINIMKRAHYALKGQDGVKTAVPDESIEWEGKQYIVNPYKLE